MSPQSPHLPFSAVGLIEWARAIGRQVARGGGFKHQERDDLIEVAVCHVLELYARSPSGVWDERKGKHVAKGFDLRRVPPGGDPEAAFRGLFHREIRNKCVRAAREMRGGGTFRTCRPENEPAPIAVLGDDAEQIPDDESEPVAGEQAELRRGLCSETMDDESRPAYGRRLAHSLTARR